MKAPEQRWQKDGRNNQPPPEQRVANDRQVKMRANQCALDKSVVSVALFAINSCFPTAALRRTRTLFTEITLILLHCVPALVRPPPLFTNNHIVSV